MKRFVKLILLSFGIFLSVMGIMMLVNFNYTFTKSGIFHFLFPILNLLQGILFIKIYRSANYTDIILQLFLVGGVVFWFWALTRAWSAG